MNPLDLNMDGYGTIQDSAYLALHGTGKTSVEDLEWHFRRFA